LTTEGYLAVLMAGVVQPGEETALVDVLNCTHALARGEKGVIIVCWQPANPAALTIFPLCVCVGHPVTVLCQITECVQLSST
jgi:hypothetical protein